MIRGLGNLVNVAAEAVGQVSGCTLDARGTCSEAGKGASCLLDNGPKVEAAELGSICVADKGESDDC